MKQQIKLGKKETGLLLGLFGVVIAALVWMLVASPLQEKAERLKRENDTLKTKAEEYQAVHARIPEYQEGIISLINDSAELIDHFPSYLENKDLFMFWANLGSSHPNLLQMADVTIEEATIAYTGQGTESINLQYDEAGNPIPDSPTAVPGTSYELYQIPVRMTYTSTYTGLKQMFNYVTEQNDKNSIDSFSAAYDDTTGELAGEITVSRYFVKGIDKAYAPEFIPSIPSGVRDIFRTGGEVLGVLSNNTAEGAADDQTGEETTE